jgi:putative membrane protein
MLISQADKTRIAEAIRSAEANTAGEIFCVLAGRSRDYYLVSLAWAAGLALLTPAPLIYFTRWPAWTLYIAQLAVFIVAAIVMSWEPLRFMLVPRRTAHDRAHRAAMRQFLAQGLQSTENRTGVLIFASLAERYAEIIADTGINAKVAPRVWDNAVAALVEGIKSGRTADGFIAAIEQCGSVLSQHFPPGALPRDELPNRLVEI